MDVTFWKTKLHLKKQISIWLFLLALKQNRIRLMCPATDPPLSIALPLSKQVLEDAEKQLIHDPQFQVCCKARWQNADWSQFWQ